MKEEKIKDPEDKSLKPSERLETLLYLFNQLYRGFSGDKELMLKNTRDQEDVIKEFKKQIGEFAGLESSVKNRIQSSIENAAKNVVSSMDEKISSATTGKVDGVVKSLEKTTDQVNAIFETQYQENKSLFWRMLIVAVMTGLLTALLTIYLFVHHVSVNLPDDKMETYAAGQFVQNLWPKLNKKEQKRLMEIEEDKIKDKPEKTDREKHIHDEDDTLN